jgi:hypothetical protein
MQTPNKSETAKTILTISVGFLVIYFLTKSSQVWFLYISVFVGVIGVVSDTLSKYIEWLWLKIGLILSYIVPNIMMGIIFFLILFPISLLSKVFRKKDVLRLKNNSNSVYSEVNREYDKSHFENMW